MFLHISKDPEARNYMPKNLDTGELIKDCVWADDAIGKYCCYLKDEFGRYVLDTDGFGGKYIRTEVRKGNIKLVKAR